MNKPSTNSYTPNIGKKADKTIWGPGWLDQTQNFPSVSGVFLTESRLASEPRVSTDILLASNTMSESDLLDHAVYFVAKRLLRESKEGIKLEDCKNKPSHRGRYPLGFGRYLFSGRGNGLNLFLDRTPL